MKIRQVKLAQTIPGTASNLIEAEKFDLHFDGTKLHVKYKGGPGAAKYKSFMVFPANIAWMEYEEVTEAPIQEGEQNITPKKGATKK